MRIVVATSGSDQLGGVFAQAYYRANGIVPVAIIEQAGRKDIGFSGLTSLLAAAKLFGFTGSLRLACSRMLHLGVYKRDWEAGLQLPWIPTFSAGSSQLIVCKSINEPAIVDQLAKLAPDLLISIGSPVIIKEAVLAVPRLGAINVHNGRLPKYRGHFGTFWEIQEGEARSFVSIHEMVAKVDMGRVLASDSLEVGAFNSFLDLMLEKKKRGGDLLAHLVIDTARAGKLPVGTQETKDEASPGYYGFPNMRQLLSFKFPKRAPVSAEKAP